MELVVAETKIIVDEVTRNDIRYIEVDDAWVFPSKRLAEEISYLVLYNYPKLSVYLLRIAFDTGGGDELSMKYYIYTQTSDGRKFAQRAGYYPLYYHSDKAFVSEMQIKEILKEGLDTLQYRVELYEDIGIVLDEDGRIDYLTQQRLKSLGIKKLLRGNKD